MELDSKCVETNRKSPLPSYVKTSIQVLPTLKLSDSRKPDRPSSPLSRICGEDRPHALLHFARYVIAAHGGTAVAQATRLSLHHEHPERVAGFLDEGAPYLLR